MYGKGKTSIPNIPLTFLLQKNFLLCFLLQTSLRRDLDETNVKIGKVSQDLIDLKEKINEKVDENNAKVKHSAKRVISILWVVLDKIKNVSCFCINITHSKVLASFAVVKMLSFQQFFCRLLIFCDETKSFC